MVRPPGGSEGAGSACPAPSCSEGGPQGLGQGRREEGSPELKNWRKAAPALCPRAAARTVPADWEARYKDLPPRQWTQPEAPMLGPHATLPHPRLLRLHVFLHVPPTAHLVGNPLYEKPKPVLWHHLLGTKGRLLITNRSK